MTNEEVVAKRAKFLAKIKAHEAKIIKLDELAKTIAGKKADYQKNCEDLKKRLADFNKSHEVKADAKKD